MRRDRTARRARGCVLRPLADSSAPCADGQTDRKERKERRAVRGPTRVARGATAATVDVAAGAASGPASLRASDDVALSRTTSWRAMSVSTTSIGPPSVASASWVTASVISASEDSASVAPSASDASVPESVLASVQTDASAGACQACRRQFHCSLVTVAVIAVGAGRPAGLEPSAGQAGARPSQFSIASQTPAAARHTVVTGAKPSTGHVAAVPLQLSGTSQTRPTAAGDPAGRSTSPGHMALPPSRPRRGRSRRRRATHGARRSEHVRGTRSITARAHLDRVAGARRCAADDACSPQAAGHTDRCARGARDRAVFTRIPRVARGARRAGRCTRVSRIAGTTGADRADGCKGIRRARPARSAATLGDIADAGRRAAARGCTRKGVRRTRGRRAGAVLGDIADADRRAAARCCTRKRVRRTSGRRAAAVLGDIADADRRAAARCCTRKRVRRTRGGRAIARLCGVADSRRGATDGPAGFMPAATQTGTPVVHDVTPFSHGFAVAHAIPAVQPLTHTPAALQVPPVQAVPAGADASAGHVASAPVQVSAASH